MFKIAVIRKTRFRVEIKPYLDILVLHLQPRCKPGQRPQCSLRKALSLLVARESQQGLAQLRGQHRRQRAVLGGLYPQSLDTGPLRVSPDSIQEHGLAYPSKSDH